ncbi:MAG: peptidoglycan DD-metalloendopeptidase family protein [Candidatus Rokubacteria bacterium]|nr:peptidoglycan DD-metalloendopeptidase family protein [Candidatus Rokubacteria bacterium]
MRGRARGVALGLLALLAPALDGRAVADPVPARTPARVHEVRQGDTLEAVARRYGVTVAAIVAANRLRDADATLRIGQRLTIPTPAISATLRRPPPADASRRPPVFRAPANMVLAVPDFGHLLPLFTWPVDGPVSSTFGRRRNGWHRGIDIKADIGVPILAAAPGVVVASGWEQRYGRVIKIEHINAFMTIYAHNSENQVEVGERIFTGQALGLVGRTGQATAHHLHFEIRQAGLAYNPLYLMPLPPRVALVAETDEEEPDDIDG